MNSIFPLENFISEDVLKDQQYLVACKKITRILLGLFMIMLFVSASLWSMHYYIQNSRDKDVPESLKNEYNLAAKNSDLLANKNNIMIRATKEDRQIIPVIINLLDSKPGEISLMKIDITGNENNEVLIEGFALDPEKFNTYVTNINTNNGVLVRATVDKLTSNGSNNYKTVLIKATQIK